MLEMYAIVHAIVLNHADTCDLPREIQERLDMAEFMQLHATPGLR